MPSITLDAERRVSADIGRVRTATVDVLRRLGFRVTSEMATLVEAQRGSAVRSAMLMPDQVPVGATVRFAAEPGGGSGCALHLTDRSVSAVVLGVQGPYQAAFQALVSAWDQALAGLDPKAASLGFPEPRWWVRGPNVEALERGHAAGQRLIGGAAARISERLSGGPRSTGPSGWSGYDGVVFLSSEGTVAMDMPTVRTLLAIPVMISSTPGALPPALAAQVVRLASAIENRLNQGGRGTLPVEVSDDQRKTFEFLHQQLGIRTQLPVRTLCVCRDCRHTKVVNLDLVRLREKNRNLKILASVVGMAGHGDPNPFTVFGTVFRQAKLDPDFVCGRCESTEADEQPVTFCPGCGDLRKEPVLMTCTKCKHDFRGLVKGVRIWQDAPPPPPVPAPLPPMPPYLPPAPLATPQLPPAPLPAPQLPPRASVPASAPVWAKQPPRFWTPKPASGPVPAPVPTPGPAAAPGFGPVLPPPVPLPPQARPNAQPDAQPADAPRQVCALCGQAFPGLWWIQIADGAFRRTLAVCATTPRCSPPSLVPPVRTVP